MIPAIVCLYIVPAIFSFFVLAHLAKKDGVALPQRLFFVGTGCIVWPVYLPIAILFWADER